VYVASNHAGIDILQIELDNKIPTLNSLADLVILDVAKNNSLSWTAFDEHPGTFIIYQDGVEIRSGDWSSNISIILPLNHFISNVYNFTIVVIDDAGNTASDNVIVTISDTLSPILKGLIELTVFEGTEEFYVSWTASDEHPDAYVIYQNSVEIRSGFWDPKYSITVFLYNLPLNVYNFTIIVSDTSGNTASYTTINPLELSAT